mmetsp:Transcript_34125/g.85615  ORF Transcript_34125/g.85615 Transcript_34125/m.85615 type:complete len:506 (-) Transcript_34125:334-1851(-)
MRAQVGHHRGQARLDLLQVADDGFDCGAAALEVPKLLLHERWRARPRGAVIDLNGIPPEDRDGSEQLLVLEDSARGSTAPLAVALERIGGRHQVERRVAIDTTRVLRQPTERVVGDAHRLEEDVVRGGGDAHDHQLVVHGRRREEVCGRRGPRLLVRRKVGAHALQIARADTALDLGQHLAEKARRLHRVLLARQWVDAALRRVLEQRLDGALGGGDGHPCVLLEDRDQVVGRRRVGVHKLHPREDLRVHLAIHRAISVDAEDGSVRILRGRRVDLVVLARVLVGQCAQIIEVALEELVEGHVALMVLHRRLEGRVPPLDLRGTLRVGAERGTAAEERVRDVDKREALGEVVLLVLVDAKEAGLRHAHARACGDMVRVSEGVVRDQLLAWDANEGGVDETVIEVGAGGLHPKGGVDVTVDVHPDLCKHCVELAEVVVLALLRFGAELGRDLVHKGPLRVLLARDWILGLVARRRHVRALRCALREAGRALVAALEPDGVSVHRRC